MEGSDGKFSELVDLVKSWFPGRTEPANEASRDFWMPDHSCRVCYECDSQFTIFNRRHHCRWCGRVFCAKCTVNSVPAPSDNLYNGREEGKRIRVCNYCFKQREQDAAVASNGYQGPNPGLSPSFSAASLGSTRSSGTSNSNYTTAASLSFSTGPYQCIACGESLSPDQSVQSDQCPDREDILGQEGKMDMHQRGLSNQLEICIQRSDDVDEYYTCCSDSEIRKFHHCDDYYAPVEFGGDDHGYRSPVLFPYKEHNDHRKLSFNKNDRELHTSEELDKMADEARLSNDCDGSSSIYNMDAADNEPVDFESNGLLWLPPEPEDVEDEQEGLTFEDEEYASGDWGHLQSSNSFGSGEPYSQDRMNKGHKKAMKHVVDGHFRALVSQLLQVENLPVPEERDRDSWLEVITALSWEAAMLLKPDTSKGDVMDPGRYLKVKCVACGYHSESVVIKGIACKKNVAHRRMPTRIERPRLLILGGALEYQRKINSLSSVDTLLQQEMDHLKMAVAKIDALHPNVLLVERTVSRYAQDYLLTKGLSLVLNVKRSLLDRIARCTGAQIVPSVDNLSPHVLGYCDLFHVEKILEEHGNCGQGGKKLVKTLMFFEGCPRPLGCTVILKGASGDELKKVKHVVQYGVFAAYHLALETSFLADEGASLPELAFKSCIAVGLPDKASSRERSICSIQDFNVPPTDVEFSTDFQDMNEMPDFDSNLQLNSCRKVEMVGPTFSTQTNSQTAESPTSFNGGIIDSRSFPLGTLCYKEQDGAMSFHNPLAHSWEVSSTSCFAPVLVSSNKVEFREQYDHEKLKHNEQIIGSNHVAPASSECIDSLDKCNIMANRTVDDGKIFGFSHSGSYVADTQSSTAVPVKEEFPPSPSEHQSILVSLSTRCVWKGTVCERAILRIKYYGSFDKPLGRFFRDHLFDQGFRCRSCEMPSEAHVHCYTHRQGSLTISVKKLSDFLLPGERDGKIWMWHRCLRCPRVNRTPPTTRRVVMSDAAWGLSFGKFLELSFSNHAAASRVASCGHSLHRDCLRFYGFGKMVACFRYASIDVHTVYLPPPKLDFNYTNLDWIQKEADEVADQAKRLFTEVLSSLRQLAEIKQTAGFVVDDATPMEFRDWIVEIEAELQKEKAQFENTLQKVIKEVRKGKPGIDILKTNKLRRQLIFQAYLWDKRLVFCAYSGKHSHEGLRNKDKLVDLNRTPRPLKNVVSIHTPSLDIKAEEPAWEKNHIANNLEETHSLLYPSISLSLECKIADTVANHGKQVQSSFSGESVPEGGTICRNLSGQFPILSDLSNTSDTKWTGKASPAASESSSSDTSVMCDGAAAVPDLEKCANGQGVSGAADSVTMSLTKGGDVVDDDTSWVRMSLHNLYQCFNKNRCSSFPRFDVLHEYNPVYLSSFQELVCQGGARWLLPVGVNDTVIPVIDDEPTSIISYALISTDYHAQLHDEGEKNRDAGDPSVSFPFYDTGSFHSFPSDKISFEPFKNMDSVDESILSISGSRSSLTLDPMFHTKSFHARVFFSDDGPLGKVKYTVTCYHAQSFDLLRRTCCPSELDFVRSLSRCKKWGAQGGKSNVFFAKSLDDRFIIKQVTKTELDSFMQFAPEYFKYLSHSISTGSPTCLAKILGIYQVSSKHLKGSKESKIDVLVMENLLFGRNLTRLYDLKGSARSRYNADSSGSNKVLLDQNLLESMPTSPIFVGNKAKRLLERAVWNDTAFLASIDVMDYSLLVGIDEEKHELILGIIDFMRQYTWDKHLETWVKASGILGGPKNASPTVVSPKQYKKRFRKAMSTYFLMVPDQWPPALSFSRSQSDLAEDTPPTLSFEP